MRAHQMLHLAVFAATVLTATASQNPPGSPTYPASPSSPPTTQQNWSQPPQSSSQQGWSPSPSPPPSQWSSPTPPKRNNSSPPPQGQQSWSQPSPPPSPQRNSSSPPPPSSHNSSSPPPPTGQQNWSSPTPPVISFLQNVSESPPSPANKSTMSIVVFRPGEGVADSIQAVCAGSETAFRQLTSNSSMSSSCLLPAGTCMRTFLYSILGIAGSFSNQELDQLSECIPGGIQYQEQDQEVSVIQDNEEASSSPNSPSSPASSGDVQVTAMEGPSELQGSVGGRKLLQAAAPQVAATAPSAHLVSYGRETLVDDKALSIETAQPNIRLLPLVDASGNPLISESAGRGTDVNALPAININNSTNGEYAGAGVKVQQLPANGGLWNLDRIDQNALPLDQEYRYGSLDSKGTGADTTIYVVDSGIRTSHQEFTSWRNPAIRRAFFGVDIVGNFTEESPEQDCDGHGTHAASVAAGRTVGVAKEATVVAVRVLDCNGQGTISDTVAGLDWVAANAHGPSVVMMSLGVPQGLWSQALEMTTRSLVTDYNITVVVASGNTQTDSCHIVPADVSETISVAASDLTNKFNQTQPDGIESVFQWSNYGSCVDIFAPGVDIYGSCGSADRCTTLNDEAYTWGSGTSFAAPHVAGVAAIYLSEIPDATPADVKAQIISASTKDAIDPSQLTPDTPNRMLFTDLTRANAEGVLNGSQRS